MMQPKQETDQDDEPQQPDNLDQDEMDIQDDGSPQDQDQYEDEDEQDEESRFDRRVDVNLGLTNHHGRQQRCGDCAQAESHHLPRAD